MSFKKLHPLLKQTIESLNLEQPTAFQKQILPVIKSGSDAYIIGEKNSGKTSALIMYTIHKLKAEAYEDSPRALILVENQENVNALRDEFLRYTSNTNLRIYATSERYDFEKQKVEIYYGQDIVIGTPGFITKLYFQNALHLGEIQIFALDDADYLARHNSYNHILRLTESMSKFQSLIIANDWNTKIANYQKGFMSHARVIKIKE